MRTPLLATTLGGILAGLALFWVLAQRSADFDPEDAALGLNTIGRTAVFEGLQVSSRSIADGRVQSAIRALRDRHRRVVLWFGASQLHAINRYRPGDELAVLHANERAAARGADLRYVQVSMPNSNWNELLVVYLQLRREGLLPARLVLACTYDDLREPGIRPGMLDDLPRITDEMVAEFGAGMSNVLALQLDHDRHAPIQRTATSGTPQERLETALTEALASASDAYAVRQNVYSLAVLKVRQMLATVTGGLLQRRAPPVPDDLKRWNEAAFETLLRLANADGVRVLLYRQPHRPDPGPFYHDRAAYDAYHAALKQRADGDGVVYLDLETLVPAEYWGITTEGRPDFFHFTAEGHRRLGEAIDRAMEAWPRDAVQ